MVLNVDADAAASRDGMVLRRDVDVAEEVKCGWIINWLRETVHFCASAHRFTSWLTDINASSSAMGLGPMICSWGGSPFSTSV